MLKRLRRQFVCIIMLIVSLLLTVMMSLVFRTTQRRLENQTVSLMRSQAQEQWKRFRPGELPEGSFQLDTFSLEPGTDGVLKASGSDRFDLSDGKYLEELYEATLESGKESDVLEDYSLRFVRVRSPRGEKIIFAETDMEEEALHHLKRSCLLVGTAALLVFLGISFLLAHWLVKPVEKAWQQQRQFVADASHELKTPLTVILTDAELLQSPATDEGIRSELTESLLVMARQMRSLVERLLELARSDNGQHSEKETSFDFSRTVEQRVMSFEPLLFEDGLMLESDIQEGLTLRGREGELAQVVDILLDNAGKYSVAPGTVKLSLRRKDSRWCVLTVETPGESLTDEDCALIFERFYRKDSVRSRGSGFGLGLSIAQELVNGHKGHISAQGVEGGNLFTVELPF